MKAKRILTGVMASAMILSALTVSASAANELSGKWYEADMNLWISRGVITGDEFGYRAEDFITRGEMATMMSRVLQYQTYAYNTFYDLPSGQYYTQPMLSLVDAGILTGSDGNMMLPNVAITREEAVTMMARTLQIDKYIAPVAGFVDQYRISPYAQNAVNSMVASGYIKGDEYGFRPQDPITRAEVATMFTRVFDESFYPGTPVYPTKDVVVKSANARVDDLHIAGDLIITADVGTGSVYLEDLIVSGDIIIQGTKVNNIHMEDVAVLGSVYDVKTKGSVKLYLTGSTDINDLYVSNNVYVDADGLSSKGDIDNIEIVDDYATLTIIDGDVNTIDITSKGDDAEVKVQSKASVNTITVYGEDASISGSGDVNRIKVYADDADIDTDDTRVDIAKGVYGTYVSGKKHGDNRTVYSNSWWDYEDDDYAVRFYANGKLYDTVWVDHGDDINDWDSMPKKPTKTGYVFDGWEYNGKNFTGDTNVYDDIKVYAKWKEISTGDTTVEPSDPVVESYTVTVYKNDDSGKYKTITVKETQNLLEELNKLSYDDKDGFMYWELDGNKVKTSTSIDEDVSIYVIWEADTDKDDGKINCSIPNDESLWN